jgi:hypothetical protein
VDIGYPDQLKAQGMNFVNFSADETAKLFSGADSIKADWISQHAAKGVPAQAIADLVASTVAKYK